MLDVLLKKTEEGMTKLFSKGSPGPGWVTVESEGESFEVKLGQPIAVTIKVTFRGTFFTERPAPFWPIEEGSFPAGSGILCVSANQARNAGKRQTFTARLRTPGKDERNAKVVFPS